MRPYFVTWSANGSSKLKPIQAPGLTANFIGGRMGGSVVVLVSYRTIADQTDRAMREIGDLVAAVLSAEPDCAGITFLQDSSDPTRLTLIEHWPSQATFLGPHMQQPHIQAFMQSAGAFLAGPPDISFLRPVSDGRYPVSADG